VLNAVHPITSDFSQFVKALNSINVCVFNRKNKIPFDLMLASNLNFYARYIFNYLNHVYLGKDLGSSSCTD